MQKSLVVAGSLLVFVAFVLTLEPSYVGLVTFDGATGQTRSAFVDPAVDDAIRSGDKVEVVITLKTNLATALSNLATTASEGVSDERKAVIKAKQAQLLGRLQRRASVGITGTEGADASVDHQLENVPIITARIGKRALAYLSSSPDVQSIYFSKPYQLALSTTVGVLNVDDVWGELVNGTNLTGAGQSVCVLDTGVDPNHPDLAANVVNQKCYCSLGGGCCQGLNMSDNATDDNGHGTHVASIIAANGNVTGVAKGASLVVVKVCNSVGSCDLADIATGFDYCINQSAAYNISAISMSISDGGAYATQAECPTSLDAAISASANANLLVSVASGNEASTTGIGYPSCSPNATSVGATVHDGTSIASYTNKGPLLDIVAPGSSVVAARAGSICSGGCVCSGSTQTCSGTSMATPHIAGIAALLAQNARLKNLSYNPGDIETFLKETSASVAGFRRVDAQTALLRQNTNYTYNASNLSLTASSARVQFRSAPNVSLLDDCFNLSFNNVTMRDSNANCTQLNVSATVRLSNLNFTNARPLLNGAVCSATECQNRSYASGVLQFDVIHFSSYTAGGIINLTVTDMSSGKFINDSVTFSANFTDGLSPANTTTGACVIALNTTGNYSAAGNMTYANATQLHTLATVFNTSFNGTYNVSCTNAGETLSVVNSFTILNDSIAPIITILSPSNNSNQLVASAVVFGYRVADNSSVVNCSLWLDAVNAATETSVDKNQNESFNITIALGLRAWNITCSDAWNYVGSSATYFVNGTETQSSPGSGDSGSSGVGSTGGSSGGGGGGGAGCVDTCSQPGFLTCAGKAELQCVSSGGCLKTKVVDCDSGHSCSVGLGCVADICSEEWMCDDWSVCSNSQQIRKCTEINGCGTEENKPALTQACASTLQVAAVETPPQPETFTGTSAVVADAADGGKVCWTGCETALQKPTLAIILMVFGLFVVRRWQKGRILNNKLS